YYFIKGGAERYFFELKKILEKNGHEVISFSMKHPQNLESPWEEFFVDEIDFNPSGFIGKAVTGIKSSARIVYSMHAKRQMEKLLDYVKPDIAHVHMIDHQISPSILPVLKSRNIPVIQTVHTYKPVCPSYRLYNMQKNRICEKCLNGSYYRAVFEKCHKGSIGASLLVAAEMYIHKSLKLYENNIDIYHVPSRFMGQKLAEGGIDKSKIRHLFYTIDMDSFPVRYDNDGYFIYYGRLSAEKGIPVLLKAFAKADTGSLKIIGTGPDKKSLERLVSDLKISRKVEFTGPVYGEQLKKLVSGAQFVVVPSEWYDNSPLVIYESLTMGKPVIGSNMGGIPELINIGVDGFIFEAKNTEQLSLILTDMLKHRNLSEMGRAARAKAEKLFDPNVHYKNMMAIYNSVIKSG
ncbi:MAG: glycosyltransferase family 1 protein, partial [Spirochaetes bacterium]